MGHIWFEILPPGGIFKVGQYLKKLLCNLVSPYQVSCLLRKVHDSEIQFLFSHTIDLMFNIFSQKKNKKLITLVFFMGYLFCLASF